MQKIWKVKQQDVSLQKRLSAALNISPVLARLLINRGLNLPEEAKAFLNPALSSLHSFNLLPDIAKAKQRIHKALANKEKVLLFSDYDADGLTSLAVLKIALDRLGVNSQAYIPHRLKEGYGLGHAAVKYALDNGFSLVITLDCGISNFQEVADLKRHNIDVIIIDHHHLHSGKLPCADAVINPKREDSDYPFKDLAGVGLSYKFASCLLEDELEEELDLVCLGTVADVAPLLGENRIIVKEGLKQLNKSGRPGLKALLEKAGIANKILNAGHISFVLGPRLNACGRIDSADAALELLLCQSRERSVELAEHLHNKNRERQRIEGGILDEALSLLEYDIDLNKERVIVLSQDNWHQGVLGIVAAKIADRFHRPAIVVSFNDQGLGKGSGRSIESFHLFEGLLECQEHLEGFGGHKKACGLSILKHNIDGFKQSINQIAQRLSAQDLLPSLHIDLGLELADLNETLLFDLEALEPFGQDNPKPVFFSNNLRIKSKPALLAKDTLKFWVTDGRSAYPAVGFGMGSYLDLVSSAKEINLAYKISRDTWNGNNQLQLEIEDIRLS